jgi:hypothetical protein
MDYMNISEGSRLLILPAKETPNKVSLSKKKFFGLEFCSAEKKKKNFRFLVWVFT